MCSTVEQQRIVVDELPPGVQGFRHIAVLLHVLHDETLVQFGLVARQIGGAGGLSGLKKFNQRFCRHAPRFHRQVGPFAVDGIHKARRITNHQPAVAIELRQRLVAAFGEEVGGVFARLTTSDQRGNRRMRLHFFKQLVGRQLLRPHIAQHATDTDRQGILVGVQKAGTDHAGGDAAEHFDGHPPQSGKVETRLDGLARQENHFLDGQRNMIRLDVAAQAGPGRQQGINAVGQNDCIGVNLAVLALDFDADDAALLVTQQRLDRHFADQQSPGRLRLLRKPFVETGADDRVTIARRGVEFLGTIMCTEEGIFFHHPHALFDQMPFQRRVFAEVRDDALQRVRVEDRPLHVFRTRIFAALQLQHLESRLGQRVGRRITRRPSADDDDIEFFAHASSPCWSPFAI